MVKVGCCGFSKGRKTYFNNFSLVEVQKTFYKPPKVSTAEKWRGESPEDFECHVDPLVNNSLYGTPRYYRLHGGRDYRHKYTDFELQKLAKMARDDCYVLFNNMYMFEDALRFKELFAND